MNWLVYVLLFVLGTIFGSFLNVLILRYKPEEPLFKNVGGRSHCAHCRKTLGWYELIPLLSFIIQGGRCRSCHEKLSFQYPLVEFLSGLILVFVPLVILRGDPGLAVILSPHLFLSTQSDFYHRLYLAAWGGIILSALWVLAFLDLLTVAVLDLRLRLIPDELNIFLGLAGAAVLVVNFYSAKFQLAAFLPASFLGSYAQLFTFTNNVWFNGLVGLIFGGGFMLFLHLVSGGRGMGFGDVKLGAAAGILMSWPDIMPVVAVSFIAGAIISSVLLAFQKKSLRSMVPFAPFFVLGITLIYFFGYDICNVYFRIFGL